MTYRVGKYTFQTVQELSNALVDYPVSGIDPVDDGYLIDFSRELTETEITFLFEIFVPPSAETLEFRQAGIDLKDEYQNAIATLTQIRDADPASVTPAQVVIAVQYIAKVLLFVIKLIVRRL